MAKKQLYLPSETHEKVIMNNTDFKINVLEGAVRSGKSYQTNILFLENLEYKKGSVILSGFSSNSVKKNVVSDWEDLLGIKIKFHNNARGEYFDIELEPFRNIIFYVAGAGKDGDEKKVQGMTVLGWLADEAATYSQSFFNMMLTRLSRRDSFAFFTLNPDSPSHWLKEWLDEKTDETRKDFVKGYVARYTFTLDDNGSLSEDYKNQMKSSFSGHMYDRLILGEWAVGEGTIYSIDKILKKTKEEIEELTKGKYSDIIKIGVDLGTAHPSAFIVSKKYGDTWYIIEEYYEKKVSPSDLAKKLNDLVIKYPGAEVYYDWAASWFFKQMEDDFPHIELQKAVKDVQKGLAYVESLILKENMVISTECPNLIKEMNGYSWDLKKDGEVIKVKDDACDALRYSIYSFEYESSYY